MRPAEPPSSTIASRIAARSTTAGTPVKSCSSTRAGVKEISTLGSAAASQQARASMSAAVTAPLPSVRSTFSSSTFSENGRLATSKREASASSRKISKVRPATFSSARASKLLADMLTSWDSETAACVRDYPACQVRWRTRPRAKATHAPRAGPRAPRDRR